jgi:REP element-mobilizing transposase RayT
MANTYTQIHIQAVFTVQRRECLITKKWEDELYKYISGIISHNDHKLLAINGMPDHVHILFGLRPSQSLSDLMQDVKGSSSTWINERKLCPGRFSWQRGYGAFSYSMRDVPHVINYILNQKNHHNHIRFIKEYMKMLDENEVIYDGDYVFDPMEIDYSDID